MTYSILYFMLVDLQIRRTNLTNLILLRIFIVVTRDVHKSNGWVNT